MSSVIDQIKEKSAKRRKLLAQQVSDFLFFRFSFNFIFIFQLGIKDVNNYSSYLGFDNERSAFKKYSNRAICGSSNDESREKTTTEKNTNLLGDDDEVIYTDSTTFLKVCGVFEYKNSIN